MNYKKVAPANKNPPRPEVRVWQFEPVNHMREELACRGTPILSGDAKKKQQVGNTKAPQNVLGKGPEHGERSRFPSEAEESRKSPDSYETVLRYTLAAKTKTWPRANPAGTKTVSEKRRDHGFGKG